MGQYFDNDNKLKDDKRVITVKIFNKTYSFNTNSGVFAKERVDYGTRLLLNNVIFHNKSGKLLDLGCGYGVIGVILGDNYRDLYIDMVDVNEKAVELANNNLKLNNVKGINCFVSNIYSNVANKYDYIITNPPIRAGKEVLFKFLLDAYEYLVDKGELWFVMRKNHGVKSMIDKLNDVYNVEVMHRDKGFYIVKCLKMK